MSNNPPIIEIDRLERSATVHGKAISMGDRTFDLLVAIGESAPDFASKTDLAQRIWPGEVVSDERLTQRVSMLRKALAESGLAQAELRNDRGRGYALTGVRIIEVASDTNTPTKTKSQARLLLALVTIAIAAIIVVALYLGDDTPPVLVDQDTGAIRISSSDGEKLPEPGRAIIEGREVLIETTFTPAILAGSPEASRALCTLSNDLSLFVLPPSARLVESLQVLSQSGSCSQL
ncbi:winged helix-turn-helix domain-containing protein [Aurantiacibacter sp. MUD61]|uniref:winged helix-turn-helix domain-containing protein n=1 Tax=Aurantiacibacter sp. MUD61 TaxID=3009083 RepID=UPI0022EFF52C|nr:winged helix-turn-helix domain-containing protein [Aurantiacibacter sp. MUD61]